MRFDVWFCSKRSAYESFATGGGSPDTAERPRVDDAEEMLDPADVGERARLAAEEAEHRKRSLASLMRPWAVARRGAREAALGAAGSAPQRNTPTAVNAVLQRYIDLTQVKPDPVDEYKKELESRPPDWADFVKRLGDEKKLRPR